MISLVYRQIIMLNKNKVGLVLGSFFGLAHLVWGILVAAGWAQPLMDFIYSLHMIDNLSIVEDFSLSKAIGLIVLTFVVGYIVGTIFAAIWNKYHGVRA